MTRVHELLLAALRVGVRGKNLEPDPVLGASDWAELLRLAHEQELLPLVYDAVYRCPSFQTLDKGLRDKYRESALRAATRQIIQNNEFLTLVLHAQAEGLDPTVLKGAVVRSLYPKPMLRPSVDEDLLVPQDKVRAYHEFFLREGLLADDPHADLAAAQELSFHKERSPTYIELHTSPLPSGSEAYGDCNAPFAGALERTVTVQIEDVTVRTLAPTDHLLFLICHAYKHFLHSGVGIRQVCDMGLFAQHNASQLDWMHIVSACRELRIDRFAAALFRIGAEHLGFSMPEAFASYDTDPEPLLEDILSGGACGANDIDRLHSSTLTLDAVAADRTGRRRGGALRSVFLPVKDMAGHYPYLRRKPWLLPVAWTQRIWGYLSRQKNPSPVNPAESLRIGKERIALLRQYGIID